MGIDVTPEQIVDELLDRVIEQVEREVPWREGARELLASLRDAGVAVRAGHHVLRALREADPGRPAAATRSRPWSPATSSTAASPTRSPTSRRPRDLDVLASECLAIEDSDTGARSAVAAGCQVLVAPLHVSVHPATGRVLAGSLVGLERTTRSLSAVAP